MKIGGALHSSSEDDDTDFRDIPFPQDTAMQQVWIVLKKLCSRFTMATVFQTSFVTVSGRLV